LSLIDSGLAFDDFPEEDLERVKWFLWHSNVYKALQVLEDLAWDIDAEASDEAQRLVRTLHEFEYYIKWPIFARILVLPPVRLNEALVVDD
jgi:hypothetical protein